MRRTWALLILCALSACDRAPAPSPAPSPTARVAALAPGVRQILADAGHADLLIGRHAFDQWADPALPVCGDQSGIDYEALLRAQPTHVLLQWGARQLPAQLERLAARHAWVVRSYPLLTLDQIMDASTDIEQAFRTAPSTLPGPADRLRAALHRRPGVHPERIGRVLLLYGVSPPTVLGPGSYHHDILLALGAEPAVASGSAFMTLDAEDLLRLAPDAIVLIQPRGGDDPSAAALPGTPPVVRLGALAKLNLPALRAQRVALIDDPKALLPGTNLADTADQLAAILEGWSASASLPAQPPEFR